MTVNVQLLLNAPQLTSNPGELATMQELRRTSCGHGKDSFCKDRFCTRRDIPLDTSERLPNMARLMESMSRGVLQCSMNVMHAVTFPPSMKQLRQNAQPQLRHCTSVLLRYVLSWSCLVYGIHSFNVELSHAGTTIRTIRPPVLTHEVVVYVCC